MQRWRLEPAKDHGLTHAQRMRSLWREHSIFGALIGYLWWGTTTIIMKLWLRFDVVGREHLPEKLPFILISNHGSHLDVISLMLAIPSKLRDRVFPLAAADHFFEDTKSATFTAMAINALPLSRKSKHKAQAEIDELRQRLLAGDTGLVLFPEGTRSRTGEMAPFKLGIGMLVAGTDIPVVPCYIDGAHAAFPAGRKLPKRCQVRLFIGEPMIFSAETADKDGYVRVSQALEARVRQLSR